MPVEKIDDILTKTHTSSKFENNGFSIGLNGVGLKCVNALSAKCQVDVKRDGKLWQFKSEKGEITQSTTAINDLDEPNETGTTITFIPDIEIMGEFEIEIEKYLEFLTQLSYMSKGLTIDFQAKRNDGKVLKKVLKSENGHLDYIKDIEKNPLIKDPVYIEDKSDDKELYMCINYSTKRDEDLILSFVNSMATTEHGTHIQGAKMALTSVFKKYIDDNKLLQKKDSNLDINGDDIIESITIILELKCIEPLFDSQTKDRLTSSDAIGYVRKVVTDQLTYYLNKNKNEAKILCNKIISNARGRRAAKNSKMLAKKKDTNPFTSISSLSKYTKASSKDPERLELFIVEGNSARRLS